MMMRELLASGDWGYGIFDAQKVPSEKENYARCLACHKGVAADSFVFALGQLQSYGR